MAYLGVLFDMDGVLVNTEPLHNLVHKQLEKKYAGGIHADNVAGRSNIQIYEEMLQRAGMDPSLAGAISQEHFATVRQLLHQRGIGPMEGAMELLEELDARGIPYGVVSSSPRCFVEKNLSDWGLTNRVRCVVAGDDGLLLKPAPDMYRAGICALRLDTAVILAVEDSSSGLRAAQAAGLDCAAFYNPDSGVHQLDHAEYHITKLLQLLPIIDRVERQQR